MQIRSSPLAASTTREPQSRSSYSVTLRSSHSQQCFLAQSASNIRLNYSKMNIFQFLAVSEAVAKMKYKTQFCDLCLLLSNFN